MDKNNSAAELSYKAINGIYVLLDMRQQPPRYVGLIKPKPFDRGFHFCPWVKSGIFFSCPRVEIPKKFRTVERAYRWVETYFSHFKPARKYTIFNPLMLWIAYTPSLFHLFRDIQLQLILIKIAIGALAVLYAFQTDNRWLHVGSVVLASVLTLVVVIDLVLFTHKWRSQK